MTDIPDALVEKAAAALRDGFLWPPGIRYNVLARAVLAAVWPDLPAARPVVDRDALAEVFETHQYALGWEGILSDGQYAWLQCTCGYKENVELPEDDIRIAEAVWERHLADAILASGVVQDAADVRRAVAAEIAAAIEAHVEWNNLHSKHTATCAARIAREVGEQA